MKTFLKTFLKSLAVVSLTIFSVISFIRLDVNIAEWQEGGRFFYAFFVLVISAITTAITESENK